jgi:hypothetical protein
MHPGGVLTALSEKIEQIRNCKFVFFRDIE